MIISVNELNIQLKTFIGNNFNNVIVEGEISKIVRHTKSGHLYFTIKDDKSAIDCAMWRNFVSRLDFEPKVGDSILVYGGVDVYVPNGTYKLIAKKIELTGYGKLQLEFERLKKELYNLGYFDEAHKKPIPKFPKKIAIITSKTGAALQDMKRVASGRWKLTKFYIFNTLMQGDRSAEDIARNIKRADEFVFSDGSKFDLIIVSRGGGSKEDLWALNKKEVADAIFQAKTPIISAIGHEIDFVISDFVADKRAATPSNAIEIALPNENDVLFYIDSLINELNTKLNTILSRKEKEVYHIEELFLSSSPMKKLDSATKEVEVLKDYLKLTFSRVISKKEENINLLKSHFIKNSPMKKLDSAFKEAEVLKNYLRFTLSKIISKKEEDINFLKSGFIQSSPILKLENRANEISKIKREFYLKISTILQKKLSQIEQLKLQFNLSKLDFFKYEKEIELLKSEFKNRVDFVLFNKEKEILVLKDKFKILNPKNSGKVDILKNGKKITIEDIDVGDLVEISNYHVKITLKALNKEKNVL